MVLPYINMNLPQVYMCSQSSPYHPSGSSQCTSPKHPISCIKPGLAIHFLYDIIHISMLFSQIIPPPTESKRLFYVSLLLSRIQGCCYHLSKFHMYALLVTSVVSDSVWPHGLKPTRLLRPWDSPGKNTGVGFHFLLQCMKVENESEVAHLCPTLRDPMDCSLPGSSIHGIFRATVLEWGAIAFSHVGS